MRDAFLPFAPPSLGPEEIEEVTAALRSDWITTGPRVERFERAFAEFVGAPDAVAVSSCSAGLHTALAVAGIGTGDAVLTTPLTFAATVNAVEHVGARPVLVDVEPDTLNIDPDAVARAIAATNGGPRPRALLPVHYGRPPCAPAALRGLADAHDLLLVEDAAHALPARYGGRRIGAAPRGAVGLTAFSFYATKNLTTGEGGMLTGDPDLLARARVFSRHGLSEGAWGRSGRARPWSYEVVLPGFKFNMTDIQAAIGLAQLRKLPAFHTRRRALAGRYVAAFRDVEELESPVERAGVDHAWHLFPLRLRPARLRIDRDRFVLELAARNVGASVHFLPVHLHPYYRDRYRFAMGDFPVAEDAYLRLLSLPLHPRMSDRDADDVIDAVLEIVRAHRR